MLKLITVLTTILVTLNTSAYTLTGNPMANGEYPYIGSCAVDRINGQWIPFGTIIKIKGLGALKVTDRFGDGRNNCVDIFMDSYNKCIEFGRQDREAEVEIP